MITPGVMRDRSGTEEKVKFQRKMSRVVEGLGSHAQGTIKASLQTFVYYRSIALAMKSLKSCPAKPIAFFSATSAKQHS